MNITEARRLEIVNWLQRNLTPTTRDNNNNYDIDSNGEVTVNGSVIAWNEDKPPPKFKHISGSLLFFSCPIVDLSFCPREVGLTVEINETPITSLKGFPKKVGGDILIKNNHNLISLRGMPRTVYGKCVIRGNRKLTSLKGGPLVCEGGCAVDSNNLTSLDHYPKIIDTRWIHADDNPVLRGGVYTDKQTGIAYRLDQSWLADLLGVELVNSKGD